MKYSEIQPLTDIVKWQRHYAATVLNINGIINEHLRDDSEIMEFLSRQPSQDPQIGKMFVAASFLFFLDHEHLLITKTHSVLVGVADQVMTFKNAITFPVTDIPAHEGLTVQKTLLFSTEQDFDEVATSARLTFPNYKLQIVDKMF